MVRVPVNAGTALFWGAPIVTRVLVADELQGAAFRDVLP